MYFAYVFYHGPLARPDTTVIYLIHTSSDYSYLLYLHAM